MLFDDISVEEIAEIRAEDAREEGREEGREIGRGEGLAEGREEASKIIASNLPAEGSTPEFVQKITGLSLEEIAGL